MALVVLTFLQNWRSAVIPLIAVPVAIIGTFAVMAALGFSLNNLTLFGLVLAIGIVVDDAIVVVEAVEHHIEHGLTPRDATILAMEQVSGPVIAVGLVLTAVFVPCAFISGITGQFFRQFALTIAVSTIISAFNSLTLSPALTAMLLRPRGKDRRPRRPCHAGLFCPWAASAVGLVDSAPSTVWQHPKPLPAAGNGQRVSRGRPGAGGGRWRDRWACSLGRRQSRCWHCFRQIQRGFNKLTTLLHRRRRQTAARQRVVLVLYVGLVLLTWSGFVSSPKGFIPPRTWAVC